MDRHDSYSAARGVHGLYTAVLEWRIGLRSDTNDSVECDIRVERWGAGHTDDQTERERIEE